MCLRLFRGCFCFLPHLLLPFVAFLAARGIDNSSCLSPLSLCLGFSSRIGFIRHSRGSPTSIGLCSLELAPSAMEYDKHIQACVCCTGVRTAHELCRVLVRTNVVALAPFVLEPGTPTQPPTASFGTEW